MKRHRLELYLSSCGAPCTTSLFLYTSCSYNIFQDLSNAFDLLTNVREVRHSSVWDGHRLSLTEHIQIIRAVWLCVLYRILEALKQWLQVHPFLASFIRILPKGWVVKESALAERERQR